MGSKGDAEVSGMQTTTLVLLPGMHGSGHLFAPLVRELPDHIRPLPVSYPPDRPLDYQGHLEIVMAALPVDEPFVLLGESFSGPLALMAAERKPKGLCGVILCATFVTCPLSLPASVAGLLVSAGLFRMKSNPLFLRMLLGKNAPEELNHLFFQALDTVRPEVLAARANAVLELDCTTALRDCLVPILAIQAGNDRIVSRRSTELTRSIRPDASVVEICGPHLILQCATAEAARVICRFIDETESGSCATLMRPLLRST